MSGDSDRGFPDPAETTEGFIWTTVCLLTTESRRNQAVKLLLEKCFNFNLQMENQLFLYTPNPILLMCFIFNCNDSLIQEWSQIMVQQKSEKLLVYSCSKNCFQQNESRLGRFPPFLPSSRTDDLQHNNCLWYKTDVCTSWRTSSFHRDKTTIILLTFNKSEKQTHNLHIPGSCWKLTKQTGVLRGNVIVSAEMLAPVVPKQKTLRLIRFQHKTTNKCAEKPRKRLWSELPPAPADRFLKPNKNQRRTKL